MEPPKHPLRLLIFHGNNARRVRLCELLDDGDTFAVVGHFATPAEAPTLHDGALPDVILLETATDHPDTAGSDLRTRYPEALIIVYSLLDDSQQFRMPIALPLMGGDTEGLAKRLRASLDSGQPLSESDTRTLLAFFPDERAAARYGLSKREKQVLRRMVEGLANKQIADVLQIGEDTVKKHLKSIYSKLEVSTGKMAVVKALRERLVP